MVLPKIVLPLKITGHQKCHTKQVLHRGPGICRRCDKKFSRPGELAAGICTLLVT